MNRSITTLILFVFQVALTGAVEWDAQPQMRLGAESFFPSSTHPVGRRGDGSNVFPGASPPISWDDVSGENIVWKTPLPAWGQSGVIVAGDRCFLTTEPHTLLCIERKTGKILWQKANDHLELWPEQEASEARLLWQVEVRKTDESWLAGFELNYLRGGRLLRFWANDYAFPPAKSPSANAKEDTVTTRMDGLWKDTPQVTNRIAELETLFIQRNWNMNIAPWSPSQGDPFRQGSDACKAANVVRTNLLAKYGLDFEYHWGYTGQAFATPVTDGQHVYATFGYGQIVCYDFDGNRIWMKWYEHDKERWTYDRDDLVSLPSPILVGDKLIVHTGFCIRALDKRTGEQIWSHSYKNWFYATGGGSPLSLLLGDTMTIVSSHGRVYRASDGKILLAGGKSHDESGKLIFSGLPQSVGSSVAHGDTVFFVDRDRSQGPYQAKTLRLDDAGGVVTQDLWTYKVGANQPMWHGPTVHDGRVYIHMTRQSQKGGGNGMLVLDAQSGATIGTHPITEHQNTEYAGAYGPDVTIAGSYAFLHTGRGATAVFSLEKEVKLLKVNHLHSQIHRHVAERNLSYREIKNEWFDRKIYPWDIWTASAPYFHGDRIYIRTHEYLICIGLTNIIQGK